MPKPTDPQKWAYQFTDDIGFSQKVVLFHPTDPTKFLTIRRSLTSTNSGMWDLPGGNVLFGELHMFSLLKEIEEEVGITRLSEPEPKLVSSIYYEDKFFYRLFIGYVAKSSTEIVRISSEHDQFEWVTADEFLKRETKDNLKKLIRKVYIDL